MSKFLLLVIAILVIYFVVKGLGRKQDKRSSPSSGERMVPCAHCGVNLPRSEAIAAAGRFFCSEEHQRLGAA